MTDFYNAVRGTVTVGGAGNLTVSTIGAGKGRPLSTLPVGWQGGLRFDDPNGTDWELSLCTMLTTTTLSRDTLLCSSTGSKVNFAVGTTALQTVVAEQLNAMLSASDIPFSASIPLTRVGPAYMAAKTVSAALTLTPAANAVRGALVYLRCIADGANLPDYSAFKEWGGSLGYDNRNGIENQMQFFFDGANYWVSITQAVGAVPAPSAATGVTMTGPTGGVVSTASTAFTVGVTPVGGMITGNVVVTPTPVADVVFTPSSLTLSSSTTTGSFTATPSAMGSFSVAITNNGVLTNPSAITYTATASVALPRLINRTSDLSETGTGPYGYSGTGPAFSATSGGVLNKALQSSTDGSYTSKFTGYVLNGSASANFIVGLQSTASPVGYASLLLALFAQSGTDTNYYVSIKSGTFGTPSSIVPADGDIRRVRRAGSTAYVEVSQDGGSTFTIIDSLTVSSGVLYFQETIGKGSGAINTLTATGLA